MAETKNLCAQIPISLHKWASEERDRLGQTTGEYITQLNQDGEPDGAHRGMRPVRFSQQRSIIPAGV